jgi:hypothetical protein
MEPVSPVTIPATTRGPGSRIVGEVTISSDSQAIQKPGPAMNNASKRLYGFRVQGRGPIVKWDREGLLDALIDQREAAHPLDRSALLRLATEASNRFAEVNGWVYTFSRPGPNDSCRQWFDMPRASAVVIHTDHLFDCTDPIFCHRKALLFGRATVDLLPRSWLDARLAAYVLRPYRQS